MWPHFPRCGTKYWWYLLYRHSSLGRPKLLHRTNKTNASLLGFCDLLNLMVEQTESATARKSWPWHEWCCPSPRPWQIIRVDSVASLFWQTWQAISNLATGEQSAFVFGRQLILTRPRAWNLLLAMGSHLVHLTSSSSALTSSWISLAVVLVCHRKQCKLYSTIIESTF